MALSLSGERSVAAATPLKPTATFKRWISGLAAGRRRRAALHSLLELDEARLRDLGIARADVFEALRADRCAGLVLSTARARRARA